MKTYFSLCIAVGMVVGCVEALYAQEAKKPEAVLRFDQAEQTEAAEQSAVSHFTTTLSDRPFAYKLNGRRTTEVKAYDEVTLWNIKRVGVKNRRMRLSDSTRREKVCLLKFRMIRDPKKGVQPHLLGNVAGCRWSSLIKTDDSNWGYRQVSPFVSAYTLRRDYDSLRRVGNELTMFKMPENWWRELPREATYVLNGEVSTGGVFQFLEGLILRRLDVYTGAEALERGYSTPLVVGDTHPDRIPLVILEGEITGIETWLRLCRANAFSTDAAVAIGYFYMMPVEAVRLYGKRGMYGAICIEYPK